MNSPSSKTWDQLKVDARAECPFSFEQSDLDAFAKLSGDSNPLHLDQAYARERGFEGTVVYGALIVAAVSRLLGMELPGPGCLWQSLSLQFTGPLYAGQKARVIGQIVYANPELSVLRLSLEVKSQDRLIARGQAQAQVLKSRP